MRSIRTIMPGALLLVLVAAPVRALPEFSVESARACNACHVEPHYWTNPETRLRKCTLGCTACHVNPTGGGPRNEAGRFYARHTLSLLDRHAAETAGSTETIPGPGDPARFAGIQPVPTLQLGGDFRGLGVFTSSSSEGDAVFPMQTDLHLVARPWNPREQNRGRVSVVVTGGAEGSRTEEFDGFEDRLFFREWWALLDDLPYQAYAKVGRFLPAFGWRLDDHTAFIRQDQSFDQERQGTGVELGLNPNYPYASLSLFASERAGTAPVPADGWGTAMTAGYRDLEWQAGGSLMYESRNDADEIWAGGNWALNLFAATHPWKGLNWLPVTYLGEVNLRRTRPESGERDRTAWAAYHQLNWHLVPGARCFLRYDWLDRDARIRDDHEHRYIVGAAAYPVSFLEVVMQYRHHAGPGHDDASGDELLIMTHVFFDLAIPLPGTGR